MLIVPIYIVSFRQSVDGIPIFPFGKSNGGLSVVQGGPGVPKLLVIARGIGPRQVVMRFRQVRLEAQRFLVILDFIAVKLLLVIKFCHLKMVRGE